ncbi:23S rRNA (uridine(2552)-2'-O)-methyltransferase RlmE [Kushneria aurantia]|uniref:Ribosomal RNA large subunit methyltransferase E n=1 Tax=Kushneria aurantia TaxID=504092 RepID=A0ABV6G674_9GAMM|nr:23S rRNA (uridine(2552)-2'-O)-methyltransferase RlmE [Kushneria aurantia]
MTRARNSRQSGQGKKSAGDSSWMKEHFDDVWVKRRWADGYRSRASYKLIEIDDRDRLLKKGAGVVDLGAAPGGWSQVAAARVGSSGRVVATDILEMDPVGGVDFIQGDFTEEATLHAMLEALDGQPVDLVLSDMAPNMSGQAAIDQPGAMYLVELALDMAQQVLSPGGDFLAKVFQGEGFDDYLAELRRHFDKVQTRKPEASRPRSREVYLLGRGFRA